MKRFLYSTILLLFTCSIFAQTLDDVGRMSIYVQRPNNGTIPAEAINLLENKMHQIITTSGISDNAFNKRFALTATVSVMKKDIISGSPARVSQTLEVTFYVKDVIDQKEYGNATISTVGVGLNENKAYIMAFNNIKSGNSRIQSMIEDSKELIVAYYRTNIDKIIADANLLAQQEQFDKALYLLAQVPDVCTECTDNCRKTTIEIYQKKIDVAGLHLLQQARAAWAGSPNANGAVQAAQFLAKIDMLASCHPDAENLMQEMTAKVKDDERKAWEYELQKYADAKAKEQRDFEFRVRQYEEREAKEQARHEEAMAKEQARYEDAMAREQARHEEEMKREQRNFEFEVHKFDTNHAKDMAIISASREVALEVAKQIPNMNSTNN